MSPGVPTLPEMTAARAAGVEVIAEIELAYRFLDPGATLIAITGTNGKSTTTALTGKLCEASGRPTFCGGNLGNMPLIDAVDHPANVPGGWIVAEVAAFMLENCTTFARARRRADEHHRGSPRSVRDDGALRRDEGPDLGLAAARRRRDRERRGSVGDGRDRGHPVASSTRSTRGAAPRAERGAFLDGARHRAPPARREERYPTDDLVIVGNHNMENAMCAYLAARLARRCRPTRSAPAPAATGRCRTAWSWSAISATSTTTTTARAPTSRRSRRRVRGFPRPLVLIAGGVDKGGSYAPMLEALDGVCKGIVLIGMAAPLIRAACAEHGVTYPVIDATDMHDAVARATALCTAGDAVVLSPACASYDMFQNFGHRGRVFRDAVAAVGGAKRLDL